MEPLRQSQTRGHTEPDHQRTQIFAPVEIGVLSGVDQIEAGYPANDACAENQRWEPQRTRLRYPGPCWRDRKREPEKEMGQAGETFRQRVKEHDRERDGESKAVVRLI